MPQLRILSAGAACILALWSAVGSVNAQDTTQSDYSAAAALLSGAPEGDALLAACPADIYRSRMSLDQRLFMRSAYQTLSECEADFLACAQTCADDADPRACLHSAILIEQSRYDQFKLSARIGHALACAHGEPAGCTNRGGGIRNVAMYGDVLSLLPWDDKVECLARTFQSSCKADDAWGCVMSGQALAYGEGVPVDEGKALAAFDKTCALADDLTHDSCQFARDLRDVLTER